MICVARRRDHRRPDRLPARREPFLVVANAGNAPVVSDALAERLARLRGGPRRSLAGDRPAGGPGPARGRGPRAADRRRPGRPPLLRRRRGDGRRDRRASWRGPATPARTASRSSSTRRGPPELWDALLDAVRAARRAADRPRRARHAPPRGRHAALRQRARPDDEPVRGRPRPGRQARQARRLRRPGRAREGRPRRTRPPLVGSDRGGPRDRPPRLSGLRRGSADAASSPAGRSRRRSASRSRWPTSHPATREPGTVVDVEIRDARVPARVVALPFYRRDA